MKVRAALLTAATCLVALVRVRGEAERAGATLRESAAAQLSTMQLGAAQLGAAQQGAAQQDAAQGNFSCIGCTSAPGWSWRSPQDNLLLQAVGAGQAAGFMLLPQFRTPMNARVGDAVTLLTTKVVGSPAGLASTDTVCTRVGGIRLGPYQCAVRGHWTQLSTEVGGHSFVTNMASVCARLNGISFGGSNQHCAVNQTMTQLTTRLPMYDSWTSMQTVCENLRDGHGGGGGVSFGSGGEFCAVPGAWTQLTTQVPGLTTRTQSMFSACNRVRGTPFGRSFQHCAVQGFTQLSTFFPDDRQSQGFTFRECDATSNLINGEVFGDDNDFCAARGEWSTINTRIVQAGNWLSQVDPSVCRAVSGVAMGRFCWTRQRVSQISVRLPGDRSWTHNNSLCTVGSDDQCVVVPSTSSQRVQVLHARTVDGSVNSDIRSQCSQLGGSPLSSSACVITSSSGDTSGGLATSPSMALAALVIAMALLVARV
jgi:hypothetical protein